MGHIPEDIIAQVIDRSDIVDVIGSYYPLKKTGSNFKASCPFHDEKTASFVVSQAKQIFHCFGCGAGGNVISFIMKHDRVEFPEAVKILAHKVNIIIPEDKNFVSGNNDRQEIYDTNQMAVDFFQHKLMSGRDTGSTAAREYLINRGISLETAQEFQLGFALDSWDGLINQLRSKNVSLKTMEKAGLVIARDKSEGYYDRFRQRIIFPIADVRGNMRAFGARVVEVENGEKVSAKYINSPETKVYTKGQHLYGFNLAKQFIAQEDQAVVVEGYLDCITPWQAGFKTIIASLGTALTMDQVRLIHRYTKNIVLLFDSDKAGQSAMLRSLDTLVEAGMNAKIAVLEAGEDPDSFVKKYGVHSFREKIKESKNLFDYKLQALVQKYDSKSPQGKNKISQEMMITIHKYDSAVLRAEYLKKLSQGLGVSEQALQTEAKNIEKPQLRGRQIESVNSSVITNSKMRTVERNILKLLLAEDGFIPSIKEEVLVADFQDLKIKKVISKMFELCEQGKKVQPSDLVNSFDDLDMQQMISGLVAEDHVVLGDKNKLYQDCVNRIKQERAKSQRQQLLQEMRDAELSGAQERLEELKQKFNQLIKLN